MVGFYLSEKVKGDLLRQQIMVKYESAAEGVDLQKNRFLEIHESK